jgi:cation diffusion facilitator CzcD-associated flavoprotein CzcO/acetyl esterase/lipase
MGTNIPLDEDTAAFLKTLADMEAPPITAGTPEEARAANAEFLRQVGIDPVDVALVQDLRISTPDGDVPARRYRDRDEPAAVLVYFHGGGWVLGDLEGHDPLCRLLAREAGVEVLNVDYRLAPEHPFPAGLNDAYAAVRWAADNLADGRPLVVAGDSSGGNLAAAVALRARDEGGPEIALQALLYPVLDHDLATDSYERLGEGHLLLRDDMAWFFDHYVPDPAQRANPYVSPLRADHLSGVAPTYLVVGGYDPLVDEALAYAQRLDEAGVAVTTRNHEELIHGFLTMPKAIPSTQRAIDEVVTEIGARVAGLTPVELDAVVVGAGLGGLYALYRLREDGLSVRALEAADGIGGTWYWNAYPGARCDVESMDYSYSFSPELEQEWTWTEKYPSQPEILRYIDHVADRFELRRDIQLETRVVAATYDEAGSRWHVETARGERFVAQFCIFATGCLSAPLQPPFEGVGNFEGEWYMTQQWPHEPVDFEGKRVAVIGTGSSGVQSIPVIARDAAHVTVFQRTPNFSVPARNRPLQPEEIAERKAIYREHREKQRWSGAGIPLDINPKGALEMTDEERVAEMERRWGYGGAPIFNVSFRDIMTDIRSNEIVQDFVRDKIRAKVAEPEIAELLCPTDHPFAAKRLCVDSHYFETFNRDNVTLVSIRENPVGRITPKGVMLQDGSEYEVDMIVFAVGYDAMSGSLLRVDIRGRGGVSLRDEWAQGPRTYLGLGMAGFPNLFTITGPGSPAVLAVMIVAIEQHVEWIAECIAYLREREIPAIEPTREAQDAWMEHVREVADSTVFPLAKNSYYVGANVPGKPRVFAIYAGGLDNYRRKCDEVAADGYDGFALSHAVDQLAAESR